MAWSYRKNARHCNSKKDAVRKAVCNKTKRKTKNEMAGWRVHGSEKDGNKRMEGQSKGSRGLVAYCKGGQGPPRAVASSKKKCGNLRFNKPVRFLSYTKIVSSEVFSTALTDFFLNLEPLNTVCSFHTHQHVRKTKHEANLAECCWTLRIMDPLHISLVGPVAQSI